MHFVIIGGDAAGMSAASRSRRNLPTAEITVLEKSADVSYSACGMPYNIADEKRDMEDLIVRSVGEFRQKQNINVLTGHLVKQIDPKQKLVSGIKSDQTHFNYSYDTLCIATGASPTTPDLPGIELPGIFVLKSLEDGRKIKSYLKSQPVNKAIIIGMGYIALEMCEALVDRNVKVDMIKPNSGLLPWMAPQLSQVVRDCLKANEVGVYDGQAILRIEKENLNLKVICKETAFKADMIIIATGVQPNSEIAVAAGIAVGPKNAIAVDHNLRTSIEGIYAAGDCADAYHVVTGERVWIPLALRANRAGWAVADNVAGKESRLEGVAGTAVFKLFDLEVARSGLSISEAMSAGFEPESVVISSRSRAHAHPGSSTIWVQMVGDKKSGRLIGAQMVGHEGTAHRINAVAIALHSRMSVSQFSQADLAYAPPFGPVWDPMLTAANQLLKKLSDS